MSLEVDHFIKRSRVQYELCYENESHARLSDIPEDLLILFFFELSHYSELNNCSLVSRQWRIVANKIVESNDKIIRRYEIFDQKQWMKICKNIGDTPLLPSGIEEFLNRPCPIWLGETISKTHMLTLIPKIINQEKLTFNSFINLTNLCEWRTHDRGFDKDLLSTPIETSCWVLMAKKVFLPYRIPNVLEAVICIITKYISCKNTLFSNLTYTQCSEKCGYYKSFVGEFNSLLKVYFGSDFLGCPPLDNFGVAPLLQFK